ncbi:hypothetical protein [Rubinisphaera brasiliensis]|uniref:Uncharacterized protein n=1 Tax=Rubinisphaera brasiliensis (strain ATCC 49424 / DSM 5305 / JCM 21570 / IAM 15109 / NBRC 103401 / IFAM 1448) TaxID=756272 RepID=F0SS30_RUBBR|nr:hypothetical protein [Rubinisphaera brasiliensis]ADY61368.1 hypothetical protein Plabr_3779 [Rubinisphaera brasiliensis DSM 5305]
MNRKHHLLRFFAPALLAVIIGLSTATTEEGYRSSYYKNGKIHVNVLGDA